MQLIRDIKQLKSFPRGCVVTIGSFDGIHRGHQALLLHLVTLARSLATPAVLITFEPMPQAFFSTQSAQPRLTSWREKWTEINSYGVDLMVCLRFNHKLAQYSAVDFVREILVEGLAIQCLIVGEDFRFGHQKQGDLQLLRQLGEQYNFIVDKQSTLFMDGQKVASSRIRAAVTQGDFSLAKLLLGRPFTLGGRVIFGTQQARQLGFPTANIAIRPHTMALQGVYAVQVYGVSKTPWPGAANLGWRPSFSTPKPLLEVYLLEWNTMIYGRFLKVEFLKKLREEKKFPDLDSLKKQIGHDVKQVKHLLNLGDN